MNPEKVISSDRPISPCCSAPVEWLACSKCGRSWGNSGCSPDSEKAGTAPKGKLAAEIAAILDWTPLLEQEAKLLALVERERRLAAEEAVRRERAVFDQSSPPAV